MDENNWVCKVCIPNSNRDGFDYEIHPTQPPIGLRIKVPFRNKVRMGVVLGYEKPAKRHASLKPILTIPTEAPLFSEAYLQWCQWLSRYYHTPLSEILALALPKHLKNLDYLLSLPQETWIQLHPNYQTSHINLSSQAKKLKGLISALEATPLKLDELKKDGFTKAIIEKACSLALCEQVQKAFKKPDLRTTELLLNPEQQSALERFSYDKFQVYLLHGVTGSGKTEVYIEAMKRVFAQGKQVLMLVPEIGLTSSLYERLKARLGVQIEMFHSGLSDKKRAQNWLKAYHGESSLVLGTRSALFSHFPNLGLIIIDEEHDLSFKQMEGVRYSAKDAAIMRAKMQNMPIVLGTATPSLETYLHAKEGKYQHIYLANKALNQSKLDYVVMDLRAQKTTHGLASNTLSLIQKHVTQGEQVLIFINRRGYAPLLFCHDCGWRMGCRDCDANMTLHQQKKLLICHHCGQKCPIPQSCQACSSEDLSPVGVGTEQLYDFLSHQFPAHQVMRFDRDVVRNKDDLEQGLESIQKQDVQIIVGTQMLAKGHHFPQLGLVVIVDADSGFYQTDFRALERLGQIITQVSGRTGRADIVGQACIQTHLPNHPLLITLLHEGYEAFMQELLQQRAEAGLPPYGFLALVRVQGKYPNTITPFMQQLKKACNKGGTEILGPAPAPMEKKAGVHRFQMILKAKKREELHQHLIEIEEYIQKHLPKGLRAFIEVDPYDWSS